MTWVLAGLLVAIVLQLASIWERLNHLCQDVDQSQRDQVEAVEAVRHAVRAMPDRSMPTATETRRMAEMAQRNQSSCVTDIGHV